MRKILVKRIGTSISEEELYDEVWKLAAVQEAAAKHGVASTTSMRRMVALLWKCAEFSEPALLVGETGGGKTTACQLVAEALGLELKMVNLHQNSEASDFIGAYRPTRGRKNRDNKLFEWVDGSLVVAMRQGTCILLDELNMAEHAVTERLNSVLEPERSLLLSEKGGGANVELIVAAENFRVFATMNPGGDFGKKELSAALQNRFTEIWVPPLGAASDDFAPIILKRLPAENMQVARVAMEAFASWSLLNGLNLSLRDVAAWSDFISAAVNNADVPPLIAFAHGARLILFDGIGLASQDTLNLTGLLTDAQQLAWQRVLEEIPLGYLRDEAASAAIVHSLAMMHTPEKLRFGPFAIQRRPGDNSPREFP